MVAPRPPTCIAPHMKLTIRKKIAVSAVLSTSSILGGLERMFLFSRIYSPTISWRGFHLIYWRYLNIPLFKCVFISGDIIANKILSLMLQYSSPAPNWLLKTMYKRASALIYKNRWIYFWLPLFSFIKGELLQNRVHRLSQPSTGLSSSTTKAHQ